MKANRCYGCMEAVSSYPCPHCGYTPGEEPDYALASGTILNGKYLVGRVLGQGGFGITYIGWDLTLCRKVAIKEYYPTGQVVRQDDTSLYWLETELAQQARENGRDMFLKEARKMSRVSSIPQIVQVQEMFQEKETAYIVMDFIEGETLKQRLAKTGPLSWQEAREVFLPVIQAMEQVHQAGLVHRDISPDNLMLLPDGGVRILDLGAAKDMNLGSGVSSAQVAKGGYSPFEQYTQRGGSGPWSDVYAMAATMYYTLTGVLPPVATDRVEEDTMDWPLLTKRGIPATVVSALQEAMRVSAKERTQTMGELYKGIVGSRCASKKRKTATSKPGKAMLIAGAAILVCAGLAAAFSWSSGNSAGKERNKALNTMEAGLDGEETKGVEEYTDSTDSAEEAARLEAYYTAERFLISGDKARAAIAFGKLGDYKDARKRSMWLWEEVAQRDTIGGGGDHTVGLKSNGTVVAAGSLWNGPFKLYDMGDWQDIVAVSAGGYHTAGLKSDGTVVAAGQGSNGELAVNSWGDIVAIGAGEYHTVGLKADGTVVTAGSNGRQLDVSEWQGIVAVTMGNNHMVGLTVAGTVVAEGDNQSGQCDVSSWRDIVAISAGSVHTVGLKADGTVIAVGNNEYGQCDVSTWKDIVAICAGGYHTVGLKADGTLVAVGYNQFGQCDVSSLGKCVAIGAGKTHTIGLKADGTVKTAGVHSWAPGELIDVSHWGNIKIPN